MIHPPDMGLWAGRSDAEDGEHALRWHERVRPWSAGVEPGLVLVGLASDAGILRNQGRPGAAEGPAALRRALAGLAWHRTGPAWDAGDVTSEGDALEAAHAELGGLLAQLLAEGHLPVVLGGGHDVAAAAFGGLARDLVRRSRPVTVGVVNLDAHLDVRAGPRLTSGTPFRNIAEACAGRGWPFRYLCLGVDTDANTEALFQAALRLGASWVEDVELQDGAGLAVVRPRLASFLSAVEVVQLSLDLDALSAATAPGVSAPAARGVPLWVAEALVRQVVASGKLALADLAELSPRLDVDGRTARAAARIAARVAGMDGAGIPGPIER
ncbi:MAG TPA: formimidoylglutamase [Anaeromyxobacter sp.]|nr:formimidoylglutamase [Anaeromyxobacter sp.]